MAWLVKPGYQLCRHERCAEGAWEILSTETLQWQVDCEGAGAEEDEGEGDDGEEDVELDGVVGECVGVAPFDE